MKAGRKSLSCTPLSRTLGSLAYVDPSAFTRTRRKIKLTSSTLSLRNEPSVKLSCGYLEDYQEIPYERIKQCRARILGDVVNIKETLQNLQESSSVCGPIHSQLKIAVEMCVKILSKPLVLCVRAMYTKSEEWAKFENSLNEILVYCDTLLNESIKNNIVIEGSGRIR